MEGHIKYQDYGGIRSEKGKVYLAEFTNKKTGDKFLKFGVTSKYDAADRFRDPEYNPWNIRILASAYGTKQQVEEVEQQFHKKYPKNFWLKEKIRGVTEIVKLDRGTRMQAIQEICQLSLMWKQLREHNENQS